MEIKAAIISDPGPQESFTIKQWVANVLQNLACPCLIGVKKRRNLRQSENACERASGNVPNSGNLPALHCNATFLTISASTTRFGVHLS